jgi:dTDP-4-amino-4,6-dideoxygalactose transaminase
MKSGWFTCGPRVARLELEMARRAGRKFAVAVSNGTAALDVALRALGIGRGDEVIVPAFSYVATAAAVAIVGATPVFCDIDPRNLGMDAASAAACVTSKTRAILCTDHGGNPCDFAALTELADRHHLPLVLDGAQSLGATFNGKPSLSHGVISTLSLHAAKTMTTIEGGMVFTDDPALARRIGIIRSQGEDPQRKYHHVELGHNFRMTELHAAIGLAQLGKLDALLENRRQLAERYRDELGLTSCPGLPGQEESRITTLPGIPGGDHGNFLFSIFVPNRDQVVERLKNRGIETRVCYPIPLYDQPIFERFKTGRCPVTEQACKTILNPPMFWGLTAAQQRRIVEAIKDTAAELARNAA